MLWTSFLCPLLCSLVLWRAVNAATTCPAIGGITCPAGNCGGECIAVRRPAAGAGAACGGGLAFTCDGTNEYCVSDLCMQISTDTTSCGACAGAGMFCVNGQCLMHRNMGAMCAGDVKCSAATATTHICYTGCINHMPTRDGANGPCSALTTQCVPPAAASTGGTTCSMICTAPPPPPPTCPTAMPKTGVCVAPAATPATACPVACRAPDMCVQNACVKKSTGSVCSGPGLPPCPNGQECVFGRCLVPATGCAACTGPDDVCVTACVPVEAAACTPTPGACTGANSICVPACLTPGGLPTTTPPRVRCQDPATNLTTPAATACEDTANPTECMRIFPVPPAPATPTAPGTPATPAPVRAPQCDDENLREAAKRCAKTCKICCELPAYSCKDETIPAGAPTCAQNKASGFCTQEGLKPLMQKLCPATCGLCATTGTAGCSDKQDGCFALQALCLNTQSNAFMKQNCAKTCDTMYPNMGFCPAAGTPGAPGTAPTANTGSNCDTNSQLCNNPLYRDLMTQYCCATCNRCGQTVGGTAGGSNNPNCQDQSTACVNWNVRGFCRSSFYPDTLKRQQCSRTCGYCT